MVTLDEQYRRLLLKSGAYSGVPGVEDAQQDYADETYDQPMQTALSNYSAQPRQAPQDRLSVSVPTTPVDNSFQTAARAYSGQMAAAQRAYAAGAGRGTDLYRTATSDIEKRVRDQEEDSLARNISAREQLLAKQERQAEKAARAAEKAAKAEVSGRKDAVVADAASLVGIVDDNGDPLVTDDGVAALRRSLARAKTLDEASGLLRMTDVKDEFGMTGSLSDAELGALNRMLESVYNPEKFQKGVKEDPDAYMPLSPLAAMGYRMRNEGIEPTGEYDVSKYSGISKNSTKKSK